MDPRLPRLVRLAELVEARDTAALAELAAEARTIEAEIARLRDTSPPSEPEAFMLGGHGALWDSWRQRELARLNRALADLRARQEPLREKAARATARAQVLNRLAGTDRA